MQLFIPELGTQLKLTRNWKVNILNEDRNYSLLDAFAGGSYQLMRKTDRIQYSLCGWQKTEPMPESEWGRHNYWRNYGMNYAEALAFYQKNRHLLENKPKYGTTTEITLPKGTILEVDRVYIRQGNARCSSVTFKIRQNKKVLRFWAKLEEVNQIHCQIVGEPAENRYADIPRQSIGG